MDAAKQAAITATGQRVLAELLDKLGKSVVGSTDNPYTNLVDALQDTFESNQMNKPVYNIKRELDIRETEAGHTFRCISIDASLGGVTVNLKSELRGMAAIGPASNVEWTTFETTDKASYFIPWGDIDNVEGLAEMFYAERVDVFRALCVMLEKLFRTQEAIKVLMSEE